MTSATFRVAAGLLRRLGEELNPSFDQSVIELVKNAYDADATTCKVTLVGGRTLRIEDDGHGMNEDEIRNGWLVLGASLKERALARTPGGRAQVGSKGLGRLAGLRLGSSTALTTTSASSGIPQTHELTISWADFDRARTIEEVELAIESRVAKGKSTGTVIEIRDLKSDFGRMDIKRLARALVLLADPFGDDPAGFHPILETNSYRDLDELVRKRYFQDAEFHLHAVLDSTGRATAELKDWRGETLFRGTHADLTGDRDSRPFAAPECSLDLWAFVLNEATFSTRKTSLAEVREWLEAFGGVHLYHNGIRVRPYGDQGHDWLDLNLRRVQNPEQRPSTNNSIGRMKVADPQQKLTQKTDRVGFIEDETFNELRAFATGAVEWMARRRMVLWKKAKDREKKVAAKHLPASKKRLEKVVGKLPAAQRDKIKAAIAVYEKNREREAKHLREDLQLYRTLATAGIVAATFAHEVQGNPIKVIRHSLATIGRRIKNVIDEAAYRKGFAESLDAISGAVESLSVLATSTLSLLAHEKRRPAKIDLNREIDRAVQGFLPFLKQRGVICSITPPQAQVFLLAPPAALESIIANVLNNAMAALEGAGVSDRRIHLSTEQSGEIVTVTIEDSGPGIQGLALDDVWLPGQTTKSGGTGLGLTIVRDIVHELGGEVSAERNGASLGGAVFRFSLPTLGG